MTRRTRGREIALQVLYQLEQNPGQGPDEVAQFIRRRLREPKLCGFAQALVDGVLEHQPRIDSLISEVAENWRLDRMAAIDRNILRLGAYELLYCDEVPTKVAINEALELAKRYSTAQSSRFVNGILDRLQAAGIAQLAKEASSKGVMMAESETESVGDLDPETTGHDDPARLAREAAREALTAETEGLGGVTPEADAREAAEAEAKAGTPPPPAAEGT